MRLGSSLLEQPADIRLTRRRRALPPPAPPDPPTETTRLPPPGSGGRLLPLTRVIPYQFHTREADPGE